MIIVGAFGNFKEIKTMKIEWKYKIILMIAFLATAFVQSTFSQDTTQQIQQSQLLSKYYNIKDALVAGNARLASDKAVEFIKVANALDYKLISEGNINALLQDATSISESKNINVQRDHFSNLSNNMATLAKSIKLSGDPIYQQYCPMKKANWLSNEKAIKNPYYGNAMLSCGNVVEIINH